MKLKEITPSLCRAFEIKLAMCKVPNNRPKASCLISFTSIPTRLRTLHLTVGSLLTQSTPPEKIVLWLNSSLKNTVPKKLLSLQSDSFELKFRDGHSSHRKLVYSLQEFRDKTVVTCDDDVMYDKVWLERLMEQHQSNPKAIIAHECRIISHDQNGELQPYKQWPYSHSSNNFNNALLPIGYGGVLYPPYSLHEDATNEDLYMKLAPKADDLWFKAMSLLQGTQLRRCSNPCKKPTPIIGAKGSSLAKSNINEDGNRKQWLAICNHYGISSLTATG